MPGRIQDRVALVTGASSGLGRAICLKLASEGAKICCVDLYDSPRNKTNASTGKADDFNNRIEGESTCAEITRLHGEGRAIFVKADVTKADDVESAISKCVSAYGRVSPTQPAAPYSSNTSLNEHGPTARHPLPQRRHLSRIDALPAARRARNERSRLGPDAGDQRQRRLPELQIRHRADADPGASARGARPGLDCEHGVDTRAGGLLQHSYTPLSQSPAPEEKEIAQH